jgi:glycerate-2-kinase
MKNKHRQILYDIFYNALQAGLPYEKVKDRCRDILLSYEQGKFNRLIVIGFGKAACPMAKAMEDSSLNLIGAGIVITKYNHCNKYNFEKIKVFEAAHPVPDENGLKGTDAIIRLLKSADEYTLVVCLISGGGSALLISPYEGVGLNDKQKITELLLKAGANIQELNTVRKHISRVKGGRLAEIVYPARIISLILSDVIDDRLDVIASGPTSPDDTTFQDALSVLEKYNLTKIASSPIIDMIQKGMHGLISETPKKGNPIFKRVENIIIGSNTIALTAAKRKAKDLSFETDILSSEVTGEAKKIGKWLVQKAIETKNIKNTNRSVCLISGGETTVTVKGSGIGGRNMELALSFAIEIDGIDGITLLSAGTDGTDGPTDAAGAIVDGKTIKKAKSLGLNPEAYLKNNDSYTFFKNTGELFITGPTGTNVMDIQIILIE